jgi:hypothetical protein
MQIGGRNYATFGLKNTRNSPYAKLLAQRKQMAQAAQKAMTNSANFSAATFGATTNLFQGLASLTLQAATQKTQAALTAKIDELKNLDVSV